MPHFCSLRYVSREPLTGETADLLQSARFLEKVSRSRNDVNTAFNGHSSTRLSVQNENHRILAADDHQGRGPDSCQRPPREVGTAAAEDDGVYGRGVASRRQRGGSTGAGSEEADRECGDLRLASSPVHRSPNPLGEERDVEAQLGRPAVDILFRRSEQVEEECPQSLCVEPGRDGTIARTVPAAPTAVSENHQSTRLIGYGQRACQTGMSYIDGDVPAVGFAHGHTAWESGSDSSRRSQRAVRSSSSRTRASSMSITTSNWSANTRLELVALALGACFDR